VAKAPVEIRSLARSHTPKALRVLSEIMDDSTVNAGARVSAAVALLDRGWGKPSQTVDLTARKAIAKDLADDELADIALGSGERAAEAPIDPTQPD
jgi:hypothetical protein